jgi:arylamine N-acetyltransferase
MAGSKFEDKQFLRYLRLLGIKKQRPSLEYLRAIVSAQLARIPFENISKLYLKKRNSLNQLINFELYLDGIENYGFGGTCYAVNFYLNQLLDWLGYQIKLCGADMKNPDVHIVNIVNIENREFLVDAGYAAPFSKPLPLDLADDYIIHQGTDRYVLKPRNDNAYSRIELYRNGALKHVYTISPKARKIDEFQQVIKESFQEGSTFMNALLLARFDHDTFIVIHNMTYSEYRGIVSETSSLDTVEQLISVIQDRFGIPGPIIHESMEGLQMQKNAWG